MADASKKIAPKSRRRTHIVRVGNREIETRGLNRHFWSDLYHRSMTVYWPTFFGSAAVLFIILNSIFACLYFIGDRPVANVTSDSIVDLFFFSIETLATVGYGDMHPQTYYAHFIATIEIFTGMSFLAVMTGLIFARFSRPRARFIFADYPVVGLHQGIPTLMIRIANARDNAISQATARLWLIRLETTAEGYQLRRYYELKLDRSEHPMFTLSWTIFHSIDETSPLYAMSVTDLAASDAAFVLNVGGVDDSSLQQLYARALYAQYDIRWNYRYTDITSISADGRLLIDYSLFHEVTPEG